jgi:DNA-binding NtrC family response regulator
MPQLDGLGAVAEINRLLPETPMIMFTLYGTGVMQEIKKCGITRLVDKLQSGALVAAVEEVLAEKGSISRGTSTSSGFCSNY